MVSITNTLNKMKDQEHFNKFRKTEINGITFMLSKFPHDTDQDRFIKKLCDEAVENEYGTPLNKMKSFTSEMESASGYEKGFKKALELLGFTLTEK